MICVFIVNDPPYQWSGTRSSPSKLILMTLTSVKFVFDEMDIIVCMLHTFSYLIG